MLRISCNDCGADAYADCACPALGHDAGVAGFHHGACPFTDLGAAVVCAPGSGCCQEAHSHDAAANACPGIGGAHDAPCPEPGSCRTWANLTAGARHPLYDGKPPPDQCPGGHCHKDLPDCTVCRPVTVTVVPGTVQVTPVIGA